MQISPRKILTNRDFVMAHPPNQQRLPRRGCNIPYNFSPLKVLTNRFLEKEIVFEGKLVILRVNPNSQVRLRRGRQDYLVQESR